MGAYKQSIVDISDAERAQVKLVKDEVIKELSTKKQSFLTEEERLKTKVALSETAIAQSKTTEDKHAAEAKETKAKSQLRLHQQSRDNLGVQKQKESERKMALSTALS